LFLTISTNVSCCQTRRRLQFYLLARQHAITSGTQHSPVA